MNTEETTFTPDYSVPPGETLEEWLEDRAMSQAELAKRIDLSAKTLNQIIRGHAPLTHETALKLESVTAIPARLWNALEMNYQSDRARLEADLELAKQVAFLDEIPLAALRKLGYVHAQNKNKIAVLKEVLSFFAVADTRAWERVWQSPTAAFRQSTAFESHPGAVAVWLRLGEIAAAQAKADDFDKAVLRQSLNILRGLTVNPDPNVFVPEIIRITSAAGVIVVFVPDVAGTMCSGATRWVNGKPIVQLSLRHKTGDHLWFTLFHELGHVILHSRHEAFIDAGTALSENESVKEAEANTFSANLLIPERDAAELPRLHSTMQIVDFALRIGVSPGIVVGRLQRDGLAPYSAYNALKTKYSFAISP